MSHGSHARVSALVAVAEPVRPKLLARTARENSATLAALNAALEATSTTSSALARAWSVDESIVRDVRAGLRPLTAERLDACPRGVVAEFARRLLAGCEDAAPVSRAPVSLHVLDAASHAGRLAEAVRDAEADGVVDDAELARIEREAVVAARKHEHVAAVCRIRRAGR